jgi:hypothetical protein
MYLLPGIDIIPSDVRGKTLIAAIQKWLLRAWDLHGAPSLTPILSLCDIRTYREGLKGLQFREFNYPEEMSCVRDQIGKDNSEKSLTQ